MAKGRKKSRGSALEPALPTRMGMERHMRSIQQALATQNFKSIEEMNADIQKHFNGKTIDADEPSDDPRERAQWLADEAFGADSREEAKRLALEALKLDPNCVDAHNILGDTARDSDQAIAHFRRAIETGERILGAEFFAENKGHFWGALETRPYMRALERLAYHCWYTGQGGEAVSLWERMLELNPNDNQGIREKLLSAYLKFDEREHASALLDRFKGDGMCGIVWGRVIYALRYEDETTRRDALRSALEMNAHVLGYLLGMNELPEHPPHDGFIMGSPEEAQLSMLVLIPMIPEEQMADIQQRLADLLLSIEDELMPNKRPQKKRGK